MQAHQSNASQGSGPHFWALQLRTQSPPHRTLAESPGCLWSIFTSPEPPSALEPCNSFSPANLFNRPGVPQPTICDHIRPSTLDPRPSTLSLQAANQRSASRKSKIKNQKSKMQRRIPNAVTTAIPICPRSFPTVSVPLRFAGAAAPLCTHLKIVTCTVHPAAATCGLSL
jgi:hypothetical protein